MEHNLTRKEKSTKLAWLIGNIVREYSKSRVSILNDDATSRAGFVRDTQNNQDLVVLVASILCHAKQEGFKDPLQALRWYDTRIQDAVDESDISTLAWHELGELLNEFDEEDFLDVALNCEVDPFVDTPKSVINLALQILDIKEKEHVVDFDCGYGEFLVSASQCSNGKSYCAGYEANTAVSQIAVARGVLANFAVVNTDKYGMIKNAVDPEFDKGFQAGRWGQKAGMMSFGAERFIESLEEIDINPFITKGTSSEWVDASLMMHFLKENGKAVILTTMGALTNTQDIQARRHFVDNQYIEAVIALPDKLFAPYTNIPCAMIVLSRNNKEMRLVDATDVFTKNRRRNELNGDDIKEIMNRYYNNDEHSIMVSSFMRGSYNLNPKRYLVEQIVVENGVRFGDIITDAKRGAQMTAKKLDEVNSTEPTGTQYIKVNNVQDGNIVGEIAYIKENESLRRYFINSEEIILSKVAMPGKVALADVPANTNWVLGANLYAISIDTTKAVPLYIKLYLESNQGMKQLTSIASGVSVPMISIEELKNMIIPLPSLSEQQKMAETYRSAVAKVEKLRKEYEEAYAALKNIINNEGR